jgi:tetratricopeptide (TPR) repeat protein
MAPFDMPLGLRTAIESGECVLFLGAGIGHNAVDENGNKAPTGGQLATELAQHFKIDAGGSEDLATIAQIVELRKGRVELEKFLAKRFAHLEPDENLRWLFSLTWKAIFTTNYDALIQRSYELLKTPTRMPLTISSTAGLLSHNPQIQVPVYHLHGALFHTSKSAILITEEDYARFHERRRMLFEVLKGELATSCILYIGYSNRDPNWKSVQSELRAEFSPSEPPVSYRVDPSTDALDIEILKARRVETITATLTEFCEQAKRDLRESRIDTTKMEQYRKAIPTDLLPSFEKNPAATLRLLNSWTYVNGAPFHEPPNTKQFLNGELPNWALVGKKQYFERDTAILVSDKLFDYATKDRPGREVFLVLGSAGYGVSTLLMSLAADLVEERVRPVFMHKPSRPLLEGDLEFAESLFESPPFFVIDNAGDVHANITRAVHRFKELGKQACFLLGERINEWRIHKDRINAKEFSIEPLSDAEVDRLLDFLEKNDALGVLKELPGDMRVAAIKNKHEKQLLVAMREATEGKAFDAIIEDEFYAITDPLCRKLYCIVCCAYQLRTYARDGVLTKLLGVSLSELYEKTGPMTEGVVIYEPIDESRGIYAARARHHLIAQIVWERCVIGREREDIVLTLLEALNLTYTSDQQFFESFIRSDSQVDSIGGFESKTKFFENACRKDPDNPYIIQHYSRMLLREQRHELALAQIDRALGLSPTVRALHHTKGLILQRLALNIESKELARRRLAQSEAEFLRVKNAASWDSYGYQSLAELYLGWAKRVDPDDEAADYINRAEEVVSEGLRNANDREGLWIVSAEIEQFVGDKPEVIKKLQKAVTSNPTGIVGRYLLSKAFRRANDPGKAIEILKPVIKNHPHEYRHCIEYALAMILNKDSYGAAIAVLRLGSLYGMRDAKYIATLGGMLFLNGEFSEAEKIFAESDKREFSLSELNRGKFLPQIPGELNKPIQMEGTISKVLRGYCFIEVPGYPDFFSLGVKIAGQPAVRGLKLRFQPVFTAKGASISNPEILEAPKKAPL